MLPIYVYSGEIPHRLRVYCCRAHIDDVRLSDPLRTPLIGLQQRTTEAPAELMTAAVRRSEMPAGERDIQTRQPSGCQLLTGRIFIGWTAPWIDLVRKLSSYDGRVEHIKHNKLEVTETFESRASVSHRDGRMGGLKNGGSTRLASSNAAKVGTDPGIILGEDFPLVEVISQKSGRNCEVS